MKNLGIDEFYNTYAIFFGLDLIWEHPNHIYVTIYLDLGFIMIFIVRIEALIA